MQSISARLALAILSALLFGACAAATPTPSLPVVVAPPSPVSVAVGMPTASQTAVESTAPLPVGRFRNTSTQAGDAYYLTIAADGTFTSTPLDLHVVGTWTIADGRVTFRETSGGDCTGQAGTYAWSYDGTTLRFMLVADPCAIRASAQMGPWRLAP